MTTNTMQRCTPSTNACATAPEGTTTRRERVVAPRADVWETPDGAHLAVELPGVAADGLDLQVEARRLTVKATPTHETVEGRELRTEWRPTTYQRTFLLTEDADREAIEAHLRHGLLTVRIPRREETRPRSIPVRVSTD